MQGHRRQGLLQGDDEGHQTQHGNGRGGGWHQRRHGHDRQGKGEEQGGAAQRRILNAALGQPVAQSAAGHDPGPAQQGQFGSEHHAGVGDVPAVGAADEFGNPGQEAVEGHAAGGVAEEDAAERLAVQPQEADQLADGNLASGGGLVAAARFPHGQVDQGRQQEARRPDDQEGQLPRMQGAEQGQTHRPGVAHQADDIAAQHHGQAGSQKQAGGVNADGAAELVGGKVVGDHRIGGRRQGGFPHPHAHPGQKQLPEAARQAAAGGGQAPQQDAGGDDGAAAAGVRQPGDGQAHGDVEDGEGEAHQQADFRVGNAQVAADGLHQQGDHLPVHEGDDVGHHQHRHHIPLIGKGARLVGARWHGLCLRGDGAAS